MATSMEGILSLDPFLLRIHPGLRSDSSDGEPGSDPGGDRGDAGRKGEGIRSIETGGRRHVRGTPVPKPRQGIRT